ncbi:MAG: TetR/AcrR family transcriptional regulator [Clostridium sp.]
MPKVIKKAKENIFKAALELFSDNGYEFVEMKEIAKKAGVSIGTLYNYYENKKEIFIEVLNESWEETFIKISKIMDNENNDDDKKREIIRTLYYDITNRKGFGANYLLNSKELSENLLIITQKIYNITSSLFKEKSVTYGEKKISLLLCDIVVLTNKYPLDQENNIEILCDVVK